MSAAGTDGRLAKDAREARAELTHIDDVDVLEALTVSAATDEARLSEARSRLSRFGVAVFPPGALPTAAIIEDWERMFAATAEHPHSVLSGESELRRLPRSFFGGQASAHELLSSPLLWSIARDVFAPYEVDCTAVCLSRDRAGPGLNRDWHHDKFPYVKFQMYVDDVGDDDGALEYALSTHAHGFYRAAYLHSRGDALITRTIPPERVGPWARLSGPAGTVVAFLGSGAHRGGDIAPGRERRVFRVHFNARWRRIDRWLERAGLAWSAARRSRYEPPVARINPAYVEPAVEREVDWRSPSGRPAFWR